MLIAMVVLAIIGAALVRMLVSDSRFIGRQEAMLGARRTARAAMNLMIGELRLVSDSGLIAASRDTIVVRVPYAFGVACRPGGSGALVVSLMPTDSLMYAVGAPAGIGWRTSAGVYTFAPLTTVASSTDLDACRADSIRVIPGGRLVEVSGVPAPQQPAPGRVTFLYQVVHYKFAPSADLPGRRGLWRKAGSSAYEELVAPFDTAARFVFLVGPGLTPSLSPPSDLTTARGIELRLIAESESVPGGRTSPEAFRLVTEVPFLNRNRAY